MAFRRRQRTPWKEFFITPLQTRNETMLFPKFLIRKWYASSPAIHRSPAPLEFRQRDRRGPVGFEVATC